MLGKLELVPNQDPHVNASKTYWRVFVDIGYERPLCLLLTETEVDRAVNRGAANPEDAVYVETEAFYPWRQWLQTALVGAACWTPVVLAWWLYASR